MNAIVERRFHIIPPSALETVWPYIKTGIARALETSDGEATVEDTRQGIASGRTQLMLFSEGDGNMGVVFMLLAFPRFKIARVLLLFGNRMDLLGEAMLEAEEWAAQQGCRFVEGWAGSESRARLFGRYGYGKKYIIVRKELKK